jgi:hypothetical protein
MFVPSLSWQMFEFLVGTKARKIRDRFFPWYLEEGPFGEERQLAAHRVRNALKL